MKGGTMKRGRVRLLVVGLLLFSVLIVGGCELTKSSNKAGTTPSAGEAVNPVGIPVTTGDLSVNVVSWAPSAGDAYFKPAAGNQYIVVDLDIMNNGKDENNVSTMLQMSLRTPDGYKYDQALYFPEPKYPDGIIAAGQKARGLVAFEVPAAIGTMNFVFQPLTDDAVTFKLQ